MAKRRVVWNLTEIDWDHIRQGFETLVKNKYSLQIHDNKPQKTFKNTGSNSTNSTLHKNYLPRPLASFSSFILVDDLIYHFQREQRPLDRNSFILLIPNTPIYQPLFLPTLIEEKLSFFRERLITFTLDLISGIIYKLSILSHIHSSTTPQMNSF